MASETGGRYNLPMSAFLVGIPVLVGASCYYIYASSRSKRQLGAKGAPPGPKELSPHEQIMQIKQAGNQNYSQKNYDAAIELYTRAIEMSETTPSIKPDDLGIFYQNRAACYEALANYKQVVDDCTMALKNKKHYQKAYTRRAKAHEKLEQLDEALLDAYSACLLDKFQSQSSMTLAETITGALSVAKAREAMKTHKFSWPSNKTIKNHFANLAHDPAKEALANEAIQSAEQLQPLLDEASKPENENDPKSIIIRATCQHLMGNSAEAHTLLDRVLALDSTEENKRYKSIATVKKSNMIIESFSGAQALEEKDVNQVLESLKATALLDPDNSDIYLPMAHVLAATEKVDEALDSLDKAIQLRKDFYPAIAQKFYLEFKKKVRDSEPPSSIKALIDGFKETLEQHPDSQDLYQIYAQILTEMNDFEQADQILIMLSNREPNDGALCISRAMMQLHLKNNTEGMVSLLEEAIKKDPRLLFAYELLGSIKNQEGKVDEAVKIFETALKHATQESEYIRCYAMLCPAASHKIAAERLGMQM